MKATILYKPEIHDKMVEALDKEVIKSQGIKEKGVVLLQKKVKLPGGKEVVIGKTINEKVNQMLTYTFNYNIINIGEIVIEFNSLADRIPLVRQYTEKCMKGKIKSEMKKEFKDGIIKIK
jgi:1-aminocyclopropane-1-carboxylate deaminase/D-cysteine desulfhydrase-like pyridoxal-dependent ACC family enzyme